MNLWTHLFGVEYQLMIEIAKLLPEIQESQLAKVRAVAESATPATDPKTIPPGRAYKKPLAPELFQYGLDPTTNMTMRYGYGFLPLPAHRPRTTSNATSASASTTSAKKKGKKKK